MRGLLAVLLLAFAVGAAPRPLQAQQQGAYRVALVPQIGLGFVGRRWEAVEGTRRAAVGPANGPHAAIALELRPFERLGVEVTGSFMSSSYAGEATYDDGQPADKVRGVGKLHMYRTTAGLLYRLRPSVPGYFSLGGGFLHHKPREETPLWEDSDDVSPTAHFGIGYDVRSQNHVLRVDGRFHLVKYGHTLGSAVQPLEPRLATDFYLSVGYLLRL